MLKQTISEGTRMNQINILNAMPPQVAVDATSTRRRRDDVFDVFCLTLLGTFIGFIMMMVYSREPTTFQGALIATIVFGSVALIMGILLFRRGAKKGVRDSIHTVEKRNVELVREMSNITAEESNKTYTALMDDELFNTILLMTLKIDKQYLELRIDYLACCFSITEMKEITGSESQLSDFPNDILKALKTRIPIDPARWIIHSIYKSVTFQTHSGETLIPENPLHPGLRAENLRLSALEIYQKDPRIQQVNSEEF